MAYWKGLISVIAGIVLLIGAALLGFVDGSWIPAIIMGGVGLSFFVAGTQYDGTSGL